MSNNQPASIYGYFSSADQVVPDYDPGLGAACPVCGKTLSPTDVRTISLMVPQDSRSYFYRVHRSCHEPLSESEQTKVDGLLIDAIYSLRNTN